MKKTKNPEKISLMFFLMLLILLPIILSSNTEEKIILSKAEESSGATPSATLVPTVNIALSPTLSPLSPTPIIPTQFPTQQVTPYPTSIQPTPSPLVFPSVYTIPSLFQTPIPSPFIPPSFSATPVVYPTKHPVDAVISTDTTIPGKINSFMQSTLHSFTLPSFSVEKTSGFIGNIKTMLDDVFGVYISSSQDISSTTNTSNVPIEVDIRPTFDRREYMHIELRERDLSPGFFTQWLDSLFKKERTRLVTYTFIMNPDGFAYASSPIVSIQASHGPFDELVDRKKTLTNVEMNMLYYFDRDGFFTTRDEAYTFYKEYPDNHQRIHTLVVTHMTGEETNAQTPLTLDQWDSMGFSELRDEKGLSLSSIIRAQPDGVKAKYANFDSATSTFTLNELYDVVRSFTTTITRDQLGGLLAGDDRVTLRIE